MSEFYTVDDVAQRLRLHVKTVRRFVRDGRLKGTRVGKQYRISRTDLEHFVRESAEHPVEPGGQSPRAEAVSAVHIEPISAGAANRITTTLLAALTAGLPEREPVRLDSTYDERRSRLSLIIAGDIGSTAELLRMVNVLSEE